MLDPELIILRGMQALPINPSLASSKLGFL